LARGGVGRDAWSENVRRLVGLHERRYTIERASLNCHVSAFSYYSGYKRAHGTVILREAKKKNQERNGVVLAGGGRCFHVTGFGSRGRRISAMTEVA
jgi:hypothetical protein